LQTLSVRSFGELESRCQDFTPLPFRGLKHLQ
jgi:hypothetical protein